MHIALSIDERNMEVNRILGWAVSRLKHYYERKQFAQKASTPKNRDKVVIDADTAAARAKYLGNMRILHHEAVSDSEYVELYYDPSTRILNKGGITLVSKDFFPFGYMLLRSIRNSFTKEDLKQHGNQSIKKAFSKIEAEKGLRKVFDSCDAAGGFTVDQASKDSIFRELIRKTFHARINEVMKRFRESNFGRHSSKGDAGTSFRGYLRVRIQRKRRLKSNAYILYYYYSFIMSSTR